MELRDSLSYFFAFGLVLVGQTSSSMPLGVHTKTLDFFGQEGLALSQLIDFLKDALFASLKLIPLLPDSLNLSL